VFLFIGVDVINQ